MSSRTIRRPSASMLVAILAVVLACAGTATAAKLLTGADIKNSSLTGADIKNKSLGIGELTAAAVSGLKGATGPAGPQGAAGAAGAPGAPGDKGDKGDTGAQGERGPSNAFVITDDNHGIEEADPGSEIVLQKTLPAGSYVVQAKFALRDKAAGDSPGRPTCAIGDVIGQDSLFFARDELKLSIADNGVEPDGETVALLAAITLDTARPIALRCDTEAASDQNALRALDVQLVATQVATIG